MVVAREESERGRGEGAVGIKRTVPALAGASAVLWPLFGPLLRSKTVNSNRNENKVMRREMSEHIFFIRQLPPSLFYPLYMPSATVNRTYTVHCIGINHALRILS